MADDREQIAWQLRANQILTELLKEQIEGECLPVMRWTIQSVGCRLYAEPASFYEDDSSVSAAVQAWANRLNLDVQRIPDRDCQTRVLAHGTYERVQVIVAATLYGDEEECCG